MAEFVKSKNAEPRYVFEFTRSELKVLADIVGDMAEERCHLTYTEDGADNVKPVKASLKRLKKMAEAIDAANPYEVTDDYFDRWETVA